jgi:hypothetical protein
MGFQISELGSESLGSLGEDALAKLKREAGKVGKSAEAVVTDGAGAVIGAAGGSMEQLLTKVTASSRFSPPVAINPADLFKPGKPPSEPSKGADWYLRLAQPTFVLESPVFGRQVIAPGGVADPKAWMLTMGLIGLGIVGVGAVIFMLGRASK